MSARRAAHRERAIVVTGANGGIGVPLVEQLARKGFRVFAAMRQTGNGATHLQEGRVVPIELDVTREESIRAAADEIAARSGPGGLAGLVNMAGVLVSGPMELVPFDEFRRQFDINVLGPFAVAKALLPLLREGRGRVVNIGAATARTTVPFLGPISASKAALAAITDAMRMEFAPFGIRVVLIEPGAIGTAIHTKSAQARNAALGQAKSEVAALYQPAIAAFEAALAKAAADKPKVVVEAVIKALTNGNPKPRVLVGKGAGQLAMLRRVPTGTRDGILMGSLGLKKPLAEAAARLPSPTHTS